MQVQVKEDDRVYNDHTPTRAEVEAVLKHCKDGTYRALLLMYCTGGRHAEITGLTWDRVNLQARTATLKGKTGKRTVPLPTQALEELLTTPEEQRVGRVMGPRPVGEQIKSACARAGVPEFTPHGVRRLVVDLLYGSTDPGTASKLLGHSPLVAMKHYRRAKASDLRGAVAAAKLGPIGAGEVVDGPWSRDA